MKKREIVHRKHIVKIYHFGKYETEYVCNGWKEDKKDDTPELLTQVSLA